MKQLQSLFLGFFLPTILNAQVGININGLLNSEEDIVISQNGNIGIGTIYSDKKLTVNGRVSVGFDKPVFSGYGNYLFLAGADANIDGIWMARYNVQYDVSQLRINLSDNYIADPTNAGDRFVVGTEDVVSKEFKEHFYYYNQSKNRYRGERSAIYARCWRNCSYPRKSYSLLCSDR